MSNLKIAFFGNSKFSVFCLEEMKNLGQTPDIIITTPDRPMGRKMQLTKSETKVWAEENNVPFIEQEKLKDETFLEKLKAYDLFIVASYGKIVPKVILDMPRYGVLNIHPSLLPKYRGPSPLQEQILNDEKNIGVTVMKMDEQIDHGPIIAQSKIEIPNWPVNLIELKAITAKVGIKLFIDNLDAWINGKIEPVEQNHAEATFTKKAEKNDGLLDLEFGKPYENYLKTKAYYPWPGTFFFIAKKHNFTTPPRHQNATPPKIGGDEAIEKKLRVIIKESEYTDGKFIITKVLPEGKKEMNYEDFLRGLK
jgi:methionyl-tRNA formyltransferase